MRHCAGAIHRAAASGKSRVPAAWRPSRIGDQGKNMSRFGIILIVLLIVLVGGVIFLSTVDTEVPPVRVEKAMLNEAAAK